MGDVDAERIAGGQSLKIKAKVPKKRRPDNPTARSAGSRNLDREVPAEVPKAELPGNLPVIHEVTAQAWPRVCPGGGDGLRSVDLPAVARGYPGNVRGGPDLGLRPSPRLRGSLAARALSRGEGAGHV